MTTKHKNDPFHPYLDNDEEIVWSDKGYKWEFHTDCGSLIGYAFMALFTLIWSGLSYIATVSMLLKGWFWFILLPHLWIGYWLFPGRFIEMYILSKTFYAITNQRILVLSRFAGNSLKSMALDDISKLDLNNNTEGATITIEGTIQQNKGKKTKVKKTKIKLENVERAPRVYQQLSTLRADAVEKKHDRLKFIYDDDSYDDTDKKQRKSMKRK